MPRITSIQIGQVRTAGDPASREIENRLWSSAFDKRPIAVSVLVGPLGIQGDAVADTVNHGGLDKAILCYAECHYPRWRELHPELDFQPGGFGENLTLAAADEASVCIGDRFETTNCIFEVSQPRQPCWKISRRWGVKTLTKTVAQTGRTGWYLRVIQPGELAAQETMHLIHRPHPDWTIERANDVLFGREVDRVSVIELMNLAVLADAWKADIA